MFSIAMKKSRGQTRYFKSIRTKLIISFCFLFLLVEGGSTLVETVGIPFTSYVGEQEKLKVEAFHNLSLLADIKKRQLIDWIEKCRDDVHVLSKNSFTASAIVRLHDVIIKNNKEGENSPELWEKVKKEKTYLALLQHLNNIKIGHDEYSKIQVVNAKRGNVIASTDQSDLGLDVSDHFCFLGALKSQDHYIGSVDDHSISNPFLHIGHIIKDPEGAIVAVLLIEINYENAFEYILHESERLGRGGDAVLVCNEGFAVISPKYPLPDGTIIKPLEHKMEAEPEELAVKGKEGVIETIDYRGEPVLAAYRYLQVTPEWGWGLVVKKDKRELLAPLQQNLMDKLQNSLVGIVAFALFTIVASKKITNPIEHLSRAADRVAEGDLAARARVFASDEIGVLAARFNSMIDRIQNWHKELEIKVEERTAKLLKTNEVLNSEIIERKQAEDSLQLFRNLIDQSGDIIFVIDPKTGHFLDFNSKATTSLGYTAEQLLSLGVVNISTIISDDLGWEKYYKEIQARKNLILEGESRRKDGTTFPVEISARYIIQENKDYIVAVARDISERKRTEEMLQQKHNYQNTLNAILNISLKPYSLEEMLDRILEQIISISWLDLQPKGVIFVVEGLPHVLIMKSYCGFDPALEEMCARVPFGRCLCGRAALNREVQFASCFDDRHENLVEEMAPHGHYCLPILSSGKLLGVLGLYLNEGHQHNKEEENVIQSIANVLAGIIERQQLEERLRKEALFDGLTGLLNRRHLNRDLHTIMTAAQRYHYPLSLCLGDVDRFKSVNDNYGHNAGDQVLVALSRIIKEEMRETDLAARYGGDEFCIVFPHTEASGGKKCLERVCRRLEKEVFKKEDGQSFSATCSFGLAELTSGMSDEEELLKFADQAMYQAKKSGGNGVALYCAGENRVDSGESG